MNKLNKLVFFGNERLATGLGPINPVVLEALVADGYDIAAVVSNFTASKSRNARPLEIAKTAKAHNIPLLLPENIKDIKKELKNFKAEAAVLVAYGKIIPKDIIEIFPKGIINIHPSLLPSYRGPAPLEQAILDAIRITGVSIMQLTSKMDAGPIFIQEKISLTGSESKQELADKLLDFGAKLLIKNMPAILDGSLKPRPQDDSKATYTNLLEKKDGYMDFKKTAEVYEREVRAYLSYPKSKAKIEGYEVIVTKARAVKRPYDFEGIIRHCGDNTALEIQELIAPSGRTMSGVDFLRGYSR